MHQDFKELLSAFNAGQVRYLIVGGYAVSFHAQPRATKDLDILIGADAENSKAVHAVEPQDIERQQHSDPTLISARDELDQIRKKGREDWLRMRYQHGESSPTLEELRAKGREDWLKLRRQRTGEKLQDHQDHAAEKAQDSESTDLSQNTDGGIDHDLK